MTRNLFLIVATGVFLLAFVVGACSRNESIAPTAPTVDETAEVTGWYECNRACDEWYLNKMREVVNDYVDCVTRGGYYRCNVKFEATVDAVEEAWRDCVDSCD